MLHFGDNYFEEEEKWGYHVKSSAKHIWAAGLELLQVIEELCRKHGLRYFADSGTLLGAVRHQGFIPWDDDIDITMLREDYNKFLEIAREELPKELEIRSIYTKEDQYEFFITIMNGTKITDDRAHLDKWHGCPYVVGVDIFPRDYVSRNKEEESLRESLLVIIYEALCGVRGDPVWDTEELLQKVEESCAVKLDRSKSLENQLLILFDRVCQLFSSDEADEVAVMTEFLKPNNTRCSKSCYEKQEWMPFETTQIAVPNNAHECLRALYGDDYMTPIIEPGHDFYAEQEELFMEAKAKQQNSRI